jgi:ATPase subunit of ABC transporter with duplicated ATPase domains
VILVSHDRYLLDRVVNRVVEIEDGRAAAFSGNYSAFRAEKLRLLIKQKQAYGEQQREVRRLEDMIKRYEVWGGEKNFRRARNKQKMLDRMDRIDRPDLDRTRIDPRFGVEARSGRITLELNGYSRGFGDRVLFDNADLLISFGECVGLLGANGSGKTTLFRDIVKEGAWENRTIRIGPRVKLGYYAQEHETLDLERTVLEEMQWGSELNKDQAFSALSKFLFGWGDMDRKIRTLSGGEKSRVQLAKLMVSSANFLLLDEPTNHLDIPSREQVEEALEGFEGTLLIISHDRYFLDKIVGRIVEVDNPNLISYAGNFSDFWTQKKSEGMEPRKKRPVGKRQAGRRTEDTEDLEQKIEVLEAKKLSLEGALSEAFRKRDYKRGERHSQQLRRLEAQIEDLYEAL